MSNGFLVVEEKEWENADAEQRSWMTFKTLKNIDLRLQKLERKSLFDKAYATVGGVIGGALAAIGIKWGA